MKPSLPSNTAASRTASSGATAGRLVLAAALALAIGGCGENPAPADQALAGTAIDPKTVLDITVEAAGANCASGGSKVRAGIDLNGNAKLDADEPGNVAYLCSGAPGAPGAAGVPGRSALIALVVEAAGTNCAMGGNKAMAGLDDDGNGALDPAEVDTTGYVCHGATGAAASTAWVDVGAAGTIAQSNKGYLANATTEVVITLPESPAVGDVVQVSGVGAGGWKIAQNAGQYILTQGLPGGTRGTPRGDSGQWQAIASSADGTKLVAGRSYDAIYLSTDSGVTWVASSSGTGNWTHAASSADGSVLAVVTSGSTIRVSADGGATWEQHDGSREWTDIAMSADGTRMVASTWNGPLFVSADRGLNWTAREGARLWNAVASSADGSRLVALAVNDGIYTSSDAGATWTRGGDALPWGSVASSADGSRLVAVANNARVFTSDDYGVTWTPRDASRQWGTVASSADGFTLFASDNDYDGSALYLSTDAGATWTKRETDNSSWTALAMNATGTKLFASTNDSNLFTFATRTTTGTAGALSGARYDSIALQYAGGGVFVPISALKYLGNFGVE